ncbi:sce7726 family protein [Lactococcus lactis]|uniref:Sce7726 family protein n=1 Tax=Lactococcus lactis subsp. lactis A12 TaxID=1137134 RepID=S6EWW9_LACLL|nr:sce7726 family protein [Lactococcus lactis]CDG05680.1 Putative uncharacterized protein [Lactococcus lactis subsp. lactis A12]SBW31747.1 Putative uncharacterized protein [Lactococcus lactis subsp. lactis]
MILDDKQIREILIKRLTTYNNCVIHEEVTVPCGKARADVVASNGHLIGYEIKSDVDSLYRLPSQIEEYDKAFEQNYIVVGEKFQDKVFDLVPNYWGIIVIKVSDEEGKGKLFFARKAKLNPKQSFRELIDFLSSNEIKYMVKETKGIYEDFTRTQIQGMVKWRLVQELEETLSKKKQLIFKKVVREVFKGKNVKEVYKNGLLL